MGRMLGARDGWAGISKRFRRLQKRPFCTNHKPSTPSNNRSSTSSHNSGSDMVDGSRSTYDEAYRRLDKLDFMTAAKILFTSPPKSKKFGIDFHLVQLFFACMPSLAVYLVAQYARYEMRRMEAELELKKQAEEEAKTKEIDLNASEEKEAGSDPELSKVKVRLDKLEEAIKEIVVESKKQLDSTSITNEEDGSKKRHHAATDPSNTPRTSKASNSSAQEHYSKQTSENLAPSSSQGNANGSAAPVTNASQQDSNGSKHGRPSKK